jgi:hypothetical protein
MMRLTVPIGLARLLDHTGFWPKVKWTGAPLQPHQAGANTMDRKRKGPSTPQISSTEAAQAATEDAVDQFCWTVAQTLKRILGLAPTGADEMDDDS